MEKHYHVQLVIVIAYFIQVILFNSQYKLSDVLNKAGYYVRLLSTSFLVPLSQVHISN